MSDDITKLVSRLETVAQRLESVEKQLASGGHGGSASGGAAAGPSSASASEYQTLIDTFIVKVQQHAAKIDPTVKQQADLLLAAVNAQKHFLELAAKSKKPSDAVFQQLLKPTSDAISQIVELKDKNRAHKFFNNLSTIAEGISALSWVCVSPTPGPHVKESKGAAEFYGNKILKDFKGKDQTQVDFVTEYTGFLNELQNYIKKFHTTGLTWNPQGGDASAAGGGAAGAAAAPKPAPAAAPAPAVAASGAPPKTANLFAELNKKGEEGVTTGLKKVTSDMKTKNIKDKSSVVPASTAGGAAVGVSAPAGTGAPGSKPAKFTLEGSRWVIEHQVGNKSVVIESPEAKHTVYIYKCHDSVIQVKGKVNSIAFDDCSKCALVFDTLVSNLEVVNCKSVQVQVTGKVNNVAIDKTHGFQLYLSKDSLACELITSTSSEMNVSFPPANAGPESDLIESAVPEQFKTVIKNGKLHTESVQHV